MYKHIRSSIKLRQQLLPGNFGFVMPSYQYKQRKKEVMVLAEVMDPEHHGKEGFCSIMVIGSRIEIMNSAGRVMVDKAVAIFMPLFPDLCVFLFDTMGLYSGYWLILFPKE